MSRASLLFPFTLFALVSHCSTGMECLQLNCACVPLIVTRPMIGTFPFFSLLLFTKNSTLNVALILVCFLIAKLISHALNGCKQTSAERRKISIGLLKVQFFRGYELETVLFPQSTSFCFLSIPQSYENCRINHYHTDSCLSMAASGVSRSFFLLKNPHHRRINLSLRAYKCQPFVFFCK